MKLGSGEELIDAYSVLHGMTEFPTNAQRAYDFNMYTVGLSADVLKACSDIDPSKLIVDVVDRNDVFKLKQPAGKSITPEQQIIVAAGLLRHGISGISDKKTKSTGKAATSIDLWEFVNASRIHLDISKDEALSLTMTEFNQLMDIKFPPEKPAISDDEYDEAMSNLARINKIRDAK